MTTETLRLSACAFCKRLSELWARGRRMGVRIGRRAPKRLRLCESLPLGERRFVAVVEFEATRFLVGGTPSALVLLSRLPDRGPDRGKGADPAENEFDPGAEPEKKRRGEKC